MRLKEKMKPSEVSTKLRQIATAIDRSKNPDRDLVTQDLRRIVSHLQIGAKFDKKTFDEVKDGIEDLINKAESMGWGSTAKKLREAKGSLKDDLEAVSTLKKQQGPSRQRIQI